MTAPYTAPRPPDAATYALVALFFVGIYLGVAAQLPGGIPIPGIIAGAAGSLLLLSEGSRVRERHVVAILFVLACYVLSVLAASDFRFLGERFKGWIQLTYSVLIGYGFFLAVTRFNRARLASMTMGFAIVILIVCALENLTPLKAVSDAFRDWAFDTGVYNADLRDQIFYSRVRPKAFTSEPSAVAFMFSFFAFIWYTMSRSRLRLVTYLLLVGAGYYFLRGPSLLLGIVLIPAYELLLASRRGPPGATRLHVGRVSGAVLMGALVVGVSLPLVQALYPERLDAIVSGKDPSFFSRVIAPPMVAAKVIATRPAAGAGLTGWEAIEEPTRQVYATAKWLSTDYRFSSAAKAITNYFWLHWIYLGLLWGVVLFAALSLLLGTLGVPSVLFCWITWAVFGQGSGSYVGPQAWAVFFAAAAISVIHERERVQKLFVSAQAVRSRRRREPWLSAPTATGGAS